MPTARRSRPREGFTLIELLVVIAIIVLLISILLPVVSTVRIKAQVTQTQAEMDKLRAAIMNYYHDWNTYPGPLANNQLVNNTPPPGGQVVTIGLTGMPVTSSENLALGLLGYIDPNYNARTTSLAMDPTLTPVGPPRPPKHDVLNLNVVTAQPKSYHYIDFVASEVSVGYWLGGPGQQRIADSTGTPQQISDTIVPEFVDTINTGIGPMTILYLRANAGVSASGGTSGIDYDARQSAAAAKGQYDISQLAPYGFTVVNVNDFPTPPTNVVANATQWTGYFMNPNLAGTPKGKDGFILISAGADRQYGTADDIIVTP